MSRVYLAGVSPDAVMTHVSRRWVLSSEVRGIEPVVEEVASLCRAAGFSAKLCRLNVPVALTEALANAMLRGNGNVACRSVVVVIELTDERLLVEITDEGRGFDLAEVTQCPSEADWLEREDGRGVFLMRQLMDRVENQCLDTGHRLRLILHKA
jgi:serine/threonine-protein kinase RsbW